jgi:hypothetical protein
VAKGHCGRVRLPVYEYIFLHNHRAVAGVEGSWRGNQHLQVFLPRSDYFNEDSFAECQRGRKPHSGLVRLRRMNTFFSMTIERRRIDRAIPCERNTPASPWAGVEGSWSRNLHLKVFPPRSDYFNEDSFAECQRGRKPIPASCDYDV